MVAWPILAARAAGAGRVAAIVSPGRDISAGLPEGVETVEQPRPDGTGGAIRAALTLIEEAETVLVLSGVCGLIIGILVLVKFPSSADWAIGLLVGIDLIFAGWTLISVAQVGKELSRGT